MNKIETIQDIKDNKILPNIVKSDILKRINDWLECKGNNELDNYIQRQIRYANLVLNLEKAKQENKN